MDITSLEFKVPLLIKGWVFQTVAMMFTALIIPGLKVKGPFGAFLAVVALAYINTTFWDWALFFKLPDSLTIKALLLILTNGIIFWVLVKILPGIEVEGIMPALAAPVIFSLLSVIVPVISGHIEWAKLGAEAVALSERLQNYFQSMAPPVQPR
jgi:uncharacterized membrane protein YvlD (DUF360 family)